MSALRNALQWEHSKLHNACQNCHSANGNISAVVLQRRVETNGNHAFACLHDESCKSQCQTRQNVLGGNKQVFALQANLRLFARQEQNNPHARRTLRNDGCKRCTANAHAQSVDKNWVQNDVCNCTNDYREHRHFGETLRCDKCVHSKCKLNKDCAKCVDTHVVGCVADGIFACAKHPQKVATPNAQHHRQNEGNDDLCSKASTQGFFCTVVVLFAHKDGCSGSSAGTN